MERLQAYTTPMPGGGVKVDVEGIAVDLITVCKADSMSKAKFLALMALTWDEVHVEVNYSGVTKQ